MTMTARPNGRPQRRLYAQIKAAETHCWLCHKRVDKTLRWPDPMSGSVHHVIPLNVGGAPLERRNLHLAHLRCNSAQGDKVNPPRHSRPWL